MQLEVLRFSSEHDSTSGLLFDVTGNQRKFLCYTVEDEYREQKVKHETRIPEGLYKLTLRSEGGFHNKHLARYGSDWHKGMIWVNDVPNFTFILWHSGNTDESTSGCLILGNSQTSNKVKPDGFVGASRDAYSEVYPLVRDAILSGESVTVKYIDFDHIDGKDFKAVGGDTAQVSSPKVDDSKVKSMVYDFSGIPEFHGPFILKSPMVKHDDIKLWQKKVGIGADGWFGKGTETKVKAVQKALGIDVTGQLDLHTWKYTFAEKKER